MPRIRDVRVSDVDKTKAVKIAMRYQNLRPQPQNPEDHDSDHPGINLPLYNPPETRNFEPEFNCISQYLGLQTFLLDVYTIYCRS